MAKPIARALRPLTSQRVAAVDLGSVDLKLLVLEAQLGRLEIVRRTTVDLKAEGLALDEVPQHLNGLLAGLEPCWLALTTPQSRMLSQIVDLPPGVAGSEVQKRLETEASQIAGLSEKEMRSSHVRLRPYGELKNPYWLCLGETHELDEHLALFTAAEAKEGEETGREPAGVAEYTTAAEALFTAAARVLPAQTTASLVEVGAEHTMVAVMVAGQGVFATTFNSGANRFSEAICAQLGCSRAEAEEMKRYHNLFGGEHRLEAVCQAVEEWHGEVCRAILEWLDEHPELSLEARNLPVYLSGGAAGQPGLAGALSDVGVLKFHDWPAPPERVEGEPMHRYWVAYGAALAGLGYAPRPFSLLPRELRVLRVRHLFWQRLQAANVLLLAVLALLLAVGTWQKMALAERKNELIDTTTAAMETAQTMELLSQRLALEYERIRPVLLRQRQTLETLEALSAMQQARSNREPWFALFADATSYFAGTTLPAAATNLTNFSVFSAGTNPPQGHLEFVAEVSIPQEGDAMRAQLSQIVSGLQQHRKPSGAGERLFSRVDTLPAERKRNLVDPRAVITNRYFALAMEIGGATNPPVAVPAAAVPPTATSNRPAAAPGSFREGRRGSLLPRTKPDKPAVPAPAGPS
jgi:Tfp pilus assembly PilM family ATPase